MLARVRKESRWTCDLTIELPHLAIDHKAEGSGRDLWPVSPSESLTGLFRCLLVRLVQVFGHRAKHVIDVPSHMFPASLAVVRVLELTLSSETHLGDITQVSVRRVVLVVKRSKGRRRGRRRSHIDDEDTKRPV